MNLQLFLDNCKAKKGEEFTHTSMTGGTWYVPNNDNQQFFKLYSKELSKKELHLTEKHMPFCGPLKRISTKSIFLSRRLQGVQ